MPHTPYTSVLKLVPPAGGVCGAATHAVGGNTGYGLLRLIVPTGYLKMPYNGKAACTLEVSKCRLLFFWKCMVGIYAYAGAGCLKQRTCACVPHTPYASVLKFVPPAGRVCGAATHAVGGNTGYGLLRLIVPTGYLKMPYNEKAACTLEISKCRLLVWRCRVNIYAHAVSGCLRA